MQQMVQSMIVKPTQTRLGWAGLVRGICVCHLCVWPAQLVCATDRWMRRAPVCIVLPAPCRGQSTGQARVATATGPASAAAAAAANWMHPTRSPRGPSITPWLVTNQRAFGYATGICGRALNPVKLLN